MQKAISFKPWKDLENFMFFSSKSIISMPDNHDQILTI